MIYIGLMSGTSLDGVDAVAVRLQPDWQVLGHQHLPFSVDARQALLALNRPADNELHHAALAANAVSRSYGEVVAQLLAGCGLQPHQVRALGAHGQTVRHQPGAVDGTGYTLQLINGSLLAELTGIDVVCDFRSRDLAAGGQGAPLVPAFHAARFDQPGRAQAVLNLGGIANLTLLPGDGSLGGFDCGPGNTLMDLWCWRHLGQAFDIDGQWAGSGRVLPGLLAAMLADPFFAQAPPKSTGRDRFHGDWLASLLSAHGPVAPADVQCTLAELTVMGAVDALKAHLPAVQTLLVCGGGAHNSHLMARLAALLPAAQVMATDAVGLPAQQVEGAAFAWLAHAYVERQAGNRPEVTGARGLRVLGALYPAG